MEKTAALNLRVNSTVKQRAEDVLASIGGYVYEQM